MAPDFDTPAPALSPYINAYILYDEKEELLSRHVHPLGTQFIWFVLAGNVTIVTKLKGEITVPPMSMLGFFTQPFRTSQTNSTRVVVINLKPHGCHALFGIDMTAYQDYFYDLALLESSKGIHEQLSLRSDMEDVKELLDEWLLCCLRESKAEMDPIDSIVGAIQMANGGMTVEQLLETFDMTERALQRLFSKCVGVNPRLYLRLYRFNCVIGQLENRERTLQELIHDVGYSDQSYFIKDFHRFTNCPPSTFRRLDKGLLSSEMMMVILEGMR